MLKIGAITCGATALLLAGCAGIVDRPRTASYRPPGPQPPAAAQVKATTPASAPNWKRVKSAISEEAHEDSARIASVVHKGAGTLRSGAGKVISGAGKVISMANFKSEPCKYPYDVCARKGDVSSQGFCWPTIGTVSRGYKRGHDGLDVLAPTGTPVYAAKSGTVIYAGKKLSGYGNVVILDHGDKVATIYGHNSKLLVETGDSVNCGQQIACVGQTGRATAPHCHFEIRQGGTPIDPKPLLP